MKRQAARGVVAGSAAGCARRWARCLCDHVGNRRQIRVAGAGARRVQVVWMCREEDCWQLSCTRLSARQGRG
eukprot:1825837-Rhodomonas_salina.1